MKVGKFFDLVEFTVSETAVRRGIDNTPPAFAITNIENVCRHGLDIYRERADRVVIVTSGYRSPKLNSAIGGAKDSQHTKGEAADIIVPGLPVSEVIRQIRAWGIPFDQLIDEFGEWVHFSLKIEGNRGEVLEARKVGGKTVYTKIA
jgi:zinc D-Ala-D-Ala carboxypeptidase